MVFRVFVEKKPGLDQEAKALLSDLKNLPGTETLSGLRLFNRYDVESITEELFALSVRTVFSEPQLDCVTKSLPEIPGSRVLAVEYLPGQFDQRADSAEQCIQILSQGDRPNVRSAKVYVFIGALSEQTWETIRSYVINPVEAREASLEKPLTLRAVIDLKSFFGSFEIIVLDFFFCADDLLFIVDFTFLCLVRHTAGFFVHIDYSGNHILHGIDTSLIKNIGIEKKREAHSSYTYFLMLLYSQSEKFTIDKLRNMFKLFKMLFAVYDKITIVHSQAV